MSLHHVAVRAGTSKSAVHAVESGRMSSVETYVRLADALGLDPEFSLHKRGLRRSTIDADPVHAAMGEAEAAQLGGHGFDLLLDEPYQHYQFSGRADLIATDRARRALLHLENRTRFPDVQDAIGSYNAKRAYLAPELASRLGIRGGFRSVTHVIVALWSAEAIHTLRLREASFRAVCPEPADDFRAWWLGSPRDAAGSSSSRVIFDPLPGQRASRRRWVGLDQVRAIDPRYRGYADALDRLRLASLA